MDNASFESCPYGELAECLSQVVEKLGLSGNKPAADFLNSMGLEVIGKIKDSNGNTVGTWSIG
jgi:hypothetical protein